MSRIASPLPLACGTLALLLLMGSAQAALFRFANQPPKPQNAEERQVLHCGDAVKLFDQGRTQEAVLLLKEQASEPMPITRDTAISVNFAPGAQVLRLAQQMCHAAKNASAVGQASRARVYLAQCHVLGARIRSTVQSDPQHSLKVATLVERAALRTEAALDSPTINLMPKRERRDRLPLTNL